MYPRFITPSTPPFDPVEVARQTEKIVCQGDKRKYTDFYTVGVYGGIATGYVVGCMFRCVFCWVSASREFPEKFGQFYSSKEAFELLKEACQKSRVSKTRISGGEPTIGKQHLLGLLEYIANTNYLFILETNGLYFGFDKDYAKQVSRFKNVHIRVSLKAGTPEEFERKTGARRDFFELPFEGIKNLIESGASFHVAAMSLDPRIISLQERLALAEKLYKIDKRLVLNLEEEVIDPYDMTLVRLKQAEIKMDFPLKTIYKPISQIKLDKK